MAKTVLGTPFSDHIDVAWGLSISGNIIFAGAGDDWIYGWDGPDFILGMEGHDTLIGGAGPDILDGGSGTDRAAYWGSPVGVTVSLTAGTGSFGTAAGDTLTNIENLAGSPHSDSLFGNDGSNWLDGSGGNDTLKGGGGADRLDGYLGDDTLQGGIGADDLDGGQGTDWALYDDSSAAVIVNLSMEEGMGGTAAGDTLVSIEGVLGSAYEDLLIGTNEAETLSGAGGNDTLKGGGGSDILTGGSGADTASYDGSASAVHASLLDQSGYIGDAEGDEFISIENLTGSAHDDFLVGGNGANRLSGLGGSDSLVGAGGADILNGGLGIDIALYGGSPTGVVVSLITGTGSGGEAEGDTLTGIENLSGSNHADQLWGNDGNNLFQGLQGDDTLKGGGGADTLYGESAWGGIGNDTLIGGAGADTMVGGFGNDTYYVDDLADVITEYAGQGNDAVFTTVSFTLTAGADVETLRTTSDNGVSSIDLIGNSSGNVIRGNNGNNVINGGDGNDDLTGLGGSDSFLFDTALNVVSNVDIVTDFNVADDTIWLDDDIFTSGLLAGNSVAGSQFVIGAAALDAGDRIIYNSATGAVYYDSDGTGAAAQIQFATLSAGLALTNFDFFVVA
jgi:Ca2+-binding RTX toxin-like protein